MEKIIIKSISNLDMIKDISSDKIIVIDLEKNDDVISLKNIKNKVIVINGTIFIKDMNIELYNTSVCYAKNNSIVNAHNRTTVYADDASKIYLFDAAYCEASDNVRIELKNNSSAKICGTAKAILFNKSKVVAIENTTVECNDNSFAVLKDNSDGVVRNYARAEFLNKSHGYIMENGEGYGYDNSFMEATNNARITLNDYSNGKIYEKSRCIIKGNGGCEGSDKSRIMKYSNYKAKTLEKIQKFTKYNDDTYIGFIKSRKIYEVNDIVRKEKEIKENIKHFDNKEHIYKVLINLENINLYNNNTLIKAVNCKVIDVIHKIVI